MGTGSVLQRRVRVKALKVVIRNQRIGPDPRLTAGPIHEILGELRGEPAFFIQDH